MNSIKEVNNCTRKCYDDIAEKYFELFKNELDEKEFDRNLLDEFSGYFNKDSLICDAGCGPVAHICRYLYNKKLDVIGTDISDKCIDIARSNNPGMIFIRNDFFEWEFPTEHFDGIISFYSIMYTPKEYIAELLKIFYKSLKPDGKLLLVVKEGTSEGYIDKVLEINTKVYEVYFTECELKEYLKNCGFEIKYFHIREPLNSEINVRRIYTIAEKIK
jgi:SAM-dependent methyltransferase